MVLNEIIVSSRNTLKNRDDLAYLKGDVIKKKGYDYDRRKKEKCNSMRTGWEANLSV